MARRFRKHWLTGEMEEIFDDPSAHFAKLNAETYEASVAKGNAVSKSKTDYTRNSAYNTPWKSEALAVPLSQMADFNEAAKRAGTGARYVPDYKRGYAHLECDSRSSRAREMKSRGVFDKDAGFSDYAGSF